MTKFKIILFAILVLFLTACGETPKENQKENQKATPTTEVEKQPEVMDIQTTESVDNTRVKTNEYIIKQGEFFGLIVGQDIADNMGELKKGTLKNGEGSFEVHYIMTEDGKRLGYLMPDPKDKTKAGTIVITSPMATTEQGIKVGDSYSKLKQVVPNVEVHGSEIESRTTASANGISYLLDAAFNTYEVDESKIKPTTKIKQISIR